MRLLFVASLFGALSLAALPAQAQIQRIEGGYQYQWLKDTSASSGSNWPGGFLLGVAGLLPGSLGDPHRVRSLRYLLDFDTSHNFEDGKSERLYSAGGGIRVYSHSYWRGPFVQVTGGGTHLHVEDGASGTGINLSADFGYPKKLGDNPDDAGHLLFTIGYRYTHIFNAVGKNFNAVRVAIILSLGG